MKAVTQDQFIMASTRQSTIMIVENEILVAKDLKMNLERMGYLVSAIASNFQEALTFAHARRPDLALMDIDIDGSKDGIQTAKELNARYQVPIVFLTSLKEMAIIDKAKESNPFGYLVKPFRSSDLQSTIEIALFNDRQSRELRKNLSIFTTAASLQQHPMLIVDENGCIDYFNTSMEVLTGFSLEEKKDSSINNILTFADMSAFKFLDSIRQEEGQGNTTMDDSAAIINRKGAKIMVQGTVNTIRDHNNARSGYLLMFHNPQELLSEDGKENFPEDSHSNDEYFFLKDKSSFYRIPLESINYVEALGNYVKVHTSGKSYMTLSPLKAIEKMLPESKFSRIHRSFVVAVNKVDYIKGQEVMVGGKMLPIGKTYRDNLMNLVKQR